MARASRCARTKEMVWNKRRETERRSVSVCVLRGVGRGGSY